MKTSTLITKTILLVIVLCTFSAFSFAQIRTPIRTNSGNQNPIEKQMLEKAKSLNLGAVHSESASMRPTAGSGGYFLRFEKGWVYYNPNTKQVYAIYGDIMNKWAVAPISPRSRRKFRLDNAVIMPLCFDNVAAADIHADVSVFE